MSFRQLQSISLCKASESDYSIFCKPVLCQKPLYRSKSTSARPCPFLLALSSLTPSRSIENEAIKVEAISDHLYESMYAFLIQH